MWALEIPFIYNTIVTTKLLFLTPEVLDELLFDHDVGSIYTNPEYDQPEKKHNIILGFIRTMDGNHQWRAKSPDNIPQANRKFGEGMPIWEDCLARRRFFTVLFKDWEYHDKSVVHDQGNESCTPISLLPPVTMETFIFTTTQEIEIPANSSVDINHFAITRCDGVKIRTVITNHQDRVGEFVEVDRFDHVVIRTQSHGFDGRLGVVHRSNHNHTGVRMIGGYMR